MDSFKMTITRCELQDLRFQESQFTWCNNRQGDVCISEQLDRALDTMAWWTQYPEALVTHRIAAHSDHLPI